MNPILVLIVVLITLVVIFLIARELVCWYWKINESLDVLKEIRDLLASQQNPIRALSPSEREEKETKKALKAVDDKELERQALAANYPDSE